MADHRTAFCNKKSKLKTDCQENSDKYQDLYMREKYLEALETLEKIKATTKSASDEWQIRSAEKQARS